MATTKSLIRTNGTGTEKLELSYISGENIKWYSHLEKEFESSIRN